MSFTSFMKNKLRNLRSIKKQDVVLGVLIFANFFQFTKINLPSQASCNQPSEIMKTNQISQNLETTVFDLKNNNSTVKVKLSNGTILCINKTTDNNTEKEVSHHQEVLKQIRAGDNNWTEAAWLLITLWMLTQQKMENPVEAFAPIRPPHHELYGSRSPYQPQRPSSLFDQKERVESMSHADALALLENKYGSNHITVEGDLKISEWQATKKICHGVCFGIKPEDYGAKQSDLHRLNKIGIGRYVREGGRLPTAEHTRAYQNALKYFCEASTNLKNEDSTFLGSPSITIFNEDTNQVAIFKPDGDDLISAYKLSPNNADTYQEKGTIGEVPKKF